MLNLGPGEAELARESLNLTELLRNYLAYGIVAVDDQERITTFSPEAAALTRLASDQVLNNPVRVLPAALSELIQETLRTGQPVIDRQIVLGPVGSEEIKVRVSTSADAASRRGVIAILNDAGATGKLERDMRRLDRLASIGTLAASMAHEIKNALVPIKTFVDLLVARDPANELAGIVGREMRRVDSIVSQLLKFSGPAKPTFAPVRVHEILERSLQLFGPQFDSRRIRHSRSFAADRDLVHGDAYQLEQAFINLFFNALEAMSENDCIHVATEIVSRPDAGVEPSRGARPFLRIDFRDSGAGIAPEDLPRLYEPFFTTKPDGTGLGLPITRRIVQEHAGTIAVQSEPGRGTTFTLEFPLWQREP